MPHRHAPQCDDQLPAFSSVGRGLRGDGYKVELHEPTDCETYLEGMIYDAATNTYHTDWMSENINGGHIMYQYNLRPYSSPQTFTITFRYDRPGHEDHEWVWTTPAIPYIWDADNNGLADVDDIIGTGVGTIFIKKVGEDWVMQDIPTNYDEEDSIGNQEKLLYPEGWTRDMFNAQLPGEPWTVNLSYGIGGDIDAPNIEDLAKILGVNVEFIRRIIAERDLPGSGDTFGEDGDGNPLNVKEYVDALDDHIHEDMGFDDILVNDGDADTATPKRNTIKKWIDWIISRLGFGPNIDTGDSDNVKDYIDDGDADTLTHLHDDLFGGESGANSDYANIPNDLKPLVGDGGNASVWDWIKYAIAKAIDNLVAGSGIKIVKSGSGDSRTATISANIVAGPGISIDQNQDGSITVYNSQVSGRWKTLRPNIDYDYTWHNGWWLSDEAQENYVIDKSTHTVYPPVVQIIESKDANGVLTGGQVKISAGSNCLVNNGNLLDQSNFKFRHASTILAVPESAIVSIEFKGDYATLNNKSILNQESAGSNIWNVEATNDPIYSSGSWYVIGASWEVTCLINRIDKTDPQYSAYRQFAVTAASIADGYNSQYWRHNPNNDWTSFVICPWANWSWAITLG